MYHINDDTFYATTTKKFWLCQVEKIHDKKMHCIFQCNFAQIIRKSWPENNMSKILMLHLTTHEKKVHSPFFFKTRKITFFFFVFERATLPILGIKSSIGMLQGSWLGLKSSMVSIGLYWSTFSCL